MPGDLDVNVPATTRGLQAALAAIDEFCASRGCTDDVQKRARVVVEELFTNTIKYGYGGECEQPVRLSLSGGAAFTVVFEDEAPPFDPTHWMPPPLPPGERPPGQAGIAMILGLSTRVTYEATAGGNRVIVVITP
ncbi:MAG: ATP-binding protein [Alphaproteobacteria bacterium]|nr:ATP-binding protein [Alphaproteobacteria bacterium]